MLVVQLLLLVVVEENIQVVAVVVSFAYVSLSQQECLH
jgi:hypothetical protein